MVADHHACAEDMIEPSIGGVRILKTMRETFHRHIPKQEKKREKE